MKIYAESVCMNLRYLRTFVMVNDLNGVAHAATRLNMTQPTASRQIQSLEEELRLNLFDRGGRELVLTPEGEDLLHRARHLLAEADAFQRRAKALTGGEAGVLRVGATPQVIETLLSRFLIGYRARHPAVDVHLLEDGGARLPIDLDNGTADVAIMPSGYDEFEVRPLFPIHAIAARRSTPVRKKRTVEVTEIADDALLLLTPEFASRRWFDAACQIAGVRPRTIIESRVPQTILALAADGHGTAIVPSTVTMHSRALQFMPVLHRGHPIGRWLTVARHKRRHLPRFGVDLIEELVAHTATDHPGRQVISGSPDLPRQG
jgi:LysR family transcriptional regulator, cyn operon transcriptional activator